MKCNYCENEATVKDYRTWNGQTGKEFVCVDCFNITNEGLLNREAKIDKVKEELFSKISKETINETADSGWNEFWSVVNMKIDNERDALINAFERETGQEPHQSTLDKWECLYLDKLDKLIKRVI